MSVAYQRRTQSLLVSHFIGNACQHLTLLELEEFTGSPDAIYYNPFNKSNVIFDGMQFSCSNDACISRTST